MSSNALLDPNFQCFEAIENIRDLQGFIDFNPVGIQSYHRLVGFYKLKEKVQCCVEKENGNLCKHEHNAGWVVEKNDGSFTIIGKDCANDKFGADPRIINDIHNANNAIRRRSKLGKLTDYIAKKIETEFKLNLLMQELNQIELTTMNFLAEIGPRLRQRLQDMVRTGNSGVVITCIKYREYIEDGHSKKERSEFQHKLGKIDGVEVTSKQTFANIYLSIKNIIYALDAAIKLDSAIQSGAKPKKGEIDSLVSRLDNISRINLEGKALKHKNLLFSQNKQILFCFLVDDKSERYKLARLAMHQTGTEGGKDAAKLWLSNFENDLKVSLNATSIEIR